MKNSFYFRFAVILFCMAFLVTGVVTNGASKAELQKQQSETNAKKKEIQAQLDEAQKRLEEQQDQLAEVAAEKHQNQSELQILENELNYILDQLNELDQNIKNTEAEYNNKVNTLKERARVMFQLSNYTTLQMFVESDSLINFINRKSYYNTMIAQDQQLIEDVANMKTELESKKALQERTKSGYEELIAEKDKIIAGLESKEYSYSKLTAKAQAAVDALEDQEEAMNKASDELTARLKKIAEEEAAQKKQSGGGSGGGSSSGGTSMHGGDPNFNGKFTWPLPGYTYISSPFGYRTHPISGQYKFHAGVDIPAPGGTPILAAAAGTVVESAYHPSHGNYIVINHGNGYATAYYHASKLIAKAGQWVSKGQTVSLVGTTGSSTGNHLHFEIRINGSTVNPLSYVAKK